MLKQFLVGIVSMSVALSTASWCLPAYAQKAPYWDNSTQSYSNSSTGNQNNNNGDTSNNNNYNNYNNNGNSGNNGDPGNQPSDGGMSNQGGYGNSGYNNNGDNQYQNNNNNYNNGYSNNNGNNNYNQGYNQPSNGYNSYSQSQGGNFQGQSGYNNQGQYGGGNNSYNQPPLRGYVSTAPAGTTMAVTTTGYLSSDNSHIGDQVSTTLANDLAMGGNVILPAGTQIEGEVVSSIPAGRTGKSGELQIRFNHASLPDGRQIPLSARLVTKDGTGIIRGGTSAQRAGGAIRNTLGGAALGAGSGLLLGALTGGGIGRGAAFGSILGAGGGLVSAGIKKGQEAKIQPGTQLQIMLDQPMNVSSNNNSSY